MADKKISALPAATTPLAGTEVLPIVQGGTTDQVSVTNLTAGRAVSGASFNVTGSAAPTNGVYLPAANSVGISTNGSVKCTIDSSGNIGVGTSGQPDRLFVYASTASSALFVRNDGAGPLQTWATFGTTRMALDGSGNLTANTGNFVVGTAGKGIDFSANTHAAGMTSELLNDYEEGNWTPTAVSSSGAITSYTSSGNYTKIGNRVFFSLQVTLTDNGTGTGVIDISLPYTAGAVSAGAGQNANSLWGLNGSIAVSGTSMRVARADGTYPGATGQTLRMSGAFIV